MKEFVLLMSVLFLVFANPVVIIDQDMYFEDDSRQEPVLDLQSLRDHIANNPEVKTYLVGGFEGAVEELIAAIKGLLRESGVEEGDVSSFISQNKDIGKQLEDMERIALEEVQQLLSSKSKAVLVFEQRKTEGLPKSRILQAEETKSQLFLNMTPTVLSGLLVALFLIVMLLIGISCNYNIKTNEKYGRNNLWVGKES